MNFTPEYDHEEDGRWIAEAPELPGVLVYGRNLLQAKAKVEALTWRVPEVRVTLEQS